MEKELIKQANKREAAYLFLTLWDKAVGKDGYDKKEWQLLRDLLYRLGVEL